jgi:hypothetical protein
MWFHEDECQVKSVSCVSLIICFFGKKMNNIVLGTSILLTSRISQIFTVLDILFTNITIYSEFMFVLVWMLFHYVLRLLLWCSNLLEVIQIAAKSSWVLHGALHDKQWRTRLSLSWIFIYKLPSTLTSQGRFLRDFVHSQLESLLLFDRGQPCYIGAPSPSPCCFYEVLEPLCFLCMPPLRYSITRLVHGVYSPTQLYVNVCYNSWLLPP